MPFASITSFSRWAPAGNETPVFVTVCHVSQLPVFGSVMAPVTLTPSTVRCTVPPPPLEATRNATEYVPALAMLTEYASHSPARTDFRL